MKVLRVGIGLAIVFVASWAMAQVATDRRRSGYQDMGEALQKMQDDDTANPGMLFVQLGGQSWAKKAGTADKSCADCHGAATTSMKGMAARYPAISKGGDTPLDLEGRINLCRTENQKAERLPPENRELLALLAYVAHQSRGMPIAPPADPRLAAFRDQGAAIYRRRQGQLNLSCAICHDDNAGKKLAGVTIPEAHPTGYPIYRLEWQGLGSLKRRLRNCLVGIRAEAYAYDAPEYVMLELFLMDRARGMSLESPGVRP
ncbi:MAG: sulfur oxidation c-type cytochrome SoxA [Reyranella sp.]|uniref:sulfur oxidation c-type cytochrome SoxA n=1 Tax=Reyranella sp. TaxID=1929291 RepID=UPI002730A5DE|nr:sulfur oxidation c-type cytochrome SoxA [Reyranella sp.]MDP1963569.1 sulfur oxidation c-type cytochrome SoxA [Reyranella sp.]MDP2378455.1 sulfur oxidation c-type cytochrome SoxA [Reyranella sp.]